MMWLFRTHPSLQRRQQINKRNPCGSPAAGAERGSYYGIVKAAVAVAGDLSGRENKEPHIRRPAVG